MITITFIGPEGHEIKVDFDDDPAKPTRVYVRQDQANLLPFTKWREYVQWNENAPTTWEFIYAPTMRIIRSYHRDGKVSKYAQRFGLTFDPGTIYEVVCEDNGYYDPSLTFYTANPAITIHSKWLKVVLHAIDISLAMKEMKILGYQPHDEEAIWCETGQWEEAA